MRQNPFITRCLELARLLPKRLHLRERVGHGRAKLTVSQRRPTRWIQTDKPYGEVEALGAKLIDGRVCVPDPESYVEVGAPETVLNQITNSGRDFLHQQGYQGTGAGQGSYTAGNGLNYIALTNTAITPGPGDTTLSGEIVANGLSRVQGVVTHTAGTNTTTIVNTFTCATSAQAAQAAALFTAASSGVMNHELTFTQRSLQVADQLIVTFTITLG